MLALMLINTSYTFFYLSINVFWLAFSPSLPELATPKVN